jgi:hypothetical protein
MRVVDPPRASGEPMGVGYGGVLAPVGMISFNMWILKLVLGSDQILDRQVVW